MKFEVIQKEPLEYKGFTGTVFYSQLYDNYFGWVKGVKGLLYYEYENMRMLKFSFESVVDDYLKYKEFSPEGYTNTEYLFEQMTEGRTYEELSDQEKRLYDQNIEKYRNWDLAIQYARRQAKEQGKNYHHLRSISEIHDSAFDIACLTTSEEMRAILPR